MKVDASFIRAGFFKVSALEGEKKKDMITISFLSTTFTCHLTDFLQNPFC